MKVIAILALMLIPFSVACGSNEKSSGTPDPSAPTTTATISAHDATCKRLGRTWVVPASTLKVSLILAVPEHVKQKTEAMSAATDQMAIEECTGKINDLALLANYQAAIAAADALICAERMGNTIGSCEKAGNEWTKSGEPLVEQVKALSAGS